MIWLIFAVLTAGVILGVTRSLYRASPPGDVKPSEIEAYKTQLQDLDRDEERGAIGKEEAQQTRAEVSRRLLRASRQGERIAAKRPKGLNAGAAFVAVAATLSLGSIAAYVHYGRPGLADQPLEARLNAPLGEQTPDVQIANMERRLRRNPADVAGWAALAGIYFKSGLFEKAADTYQRAIDAGGRTESLLLGLTESLTFANDGFIPDQAVRALDAALTLNPHSTRARFWSALLAEQGGKKAEAEKIYRDLLAAAPVPSALRKIVTQRLAALEASPESGAAAEANAADSPEDRGAEQKMIRSMVERLAARLKQDKSDLDGWVMLIRSYAVLKEADKAKAAMAAAREQFASDPKALAEIDAITNELSFAFTSTPAAPENKDAAAAQAPAATPFGGEQGQMIRGMVDRLAERLKENKSDLEGWLKLIRSYAVLKETEKAEAAAASARREFASDAKALEQIDALTGGLGLASPPANGGTPKS